MTAERLLLALENSLSKYPACEGRFPCVDGVRFAFDPSKPPGSRVVPGSVYVRDRPLVRRRSSQLRGQKLSMIVTEDDTHAANKVVVAGVPKGFSPLDASKTFSLVSTAYLIKGKVGSFIEIHCYVRFMPNASPNSGYLRHRMDLTRLLMEHPLYEKKTNAP